MSAELERRRELDPDRLPWVKQSWESLPAFHGFALYRDIGGSSITEAARLLHETTPRRAVDAIRRQFAEWSRFNRWVERAEAYVMHLDQRHREQREGQVGRMNRRYAAAAATVSAALLTRISDPARLETLVAELDVEALVRALATVQQVEGKAMGQIIGNVGRSALAISSTDVERIFRDLVELALPFVPAERQALYAQAVQAYVNTGQRPVA